MILPIYLYGQSVLRKETEEVENTDEVKTLISDMWETLKQADGCGLAAPQVGILKRIVVIDVGEGPYVLINPVIRF